MPAKELGCTRNLRGVHQRFQRLSEELCKVEGRNPHTGNKRRAGSRSNSKLLRQRHLFGGGGWHSLWGHGIDEYYGGLLYLHPNLIRPVASTFWGKALQVNVGEPNQYIPGGPDDGPGEVTCTADSARGNAVQRGIHRLFNLLESLNPMVKQQQDTTHVVIISCCRAENMW